MSNSSNHIFISYSRRDEEDAAALEKALRAAGYVVWCDETSISAGEEPISELRNTAISDAAMVVLLISESWLSSEYAQRELQSAISAGNTVLPILLGSTDVSSLPSSIAHLQVVHASDGILAALPEVMSAHEYQEVPKTPIGPKAEEAPAPSPAEASVNQTAKIHVFVSYSHDDKRWFEREYFDESPLIPWLDRMLGPYDVELWYDRKRLGAGDLFREEIERQIDRADIALLLVSPEFMVSDFITTVELPRIKRRLDGGEICVIPLITKPCSYEELGLQSSVLHIPGEQKTLIDYIDSEREFVNVRADIVQAIRRQVDMVRNRRAAKPPTEEPAKQKAEDEAETETISDEEAPSVEATEEEEVQRVEVPAKPRDTVVQGDQPWEQPGTEVGQEIAGPDGGIMVWVPAGEFMMGSAEDDEHAREDEKPAHRVRITKGFWMAKHTVTNAQYREFCEATGQPFPEDSDQGDHHPVVYTNWNDAVAYAEYYGLSLPTEAQWEYAARGPESLKYPWGNQWDGSKLCWGHNQGLGGRSFPVGSFPRGASWVGALDMAGNVRQWCADYGDNDYYARSPVDDPLGPSEGTCRVLRGSSWDNLQSWCRSARRSNVTRGCAGFDRGFRVARS